jgi:hypothetical protein
MILHRFQLNYTNGQIKTLFKFCRQYKRTKLYRQCIDMLENDTLISFSINNE